MENKLPTPDRTILVGVVWGKETQESVDRSLDELEVLKEEGTLEKAVVPVWNFIKYPRIAVSESQAKRFKNGGELFLDRVKGLSENIFYNVFSPEGKFLGIGEKDEEAGLLKVKRVYVD